MQRFTPLLVDAARPCRHAVGDRWFVDETYVKVAGRWRYVYRAVDQYGQVIDVFVSARRDADGARRFFERAIGATTARPPRSSPTGRRLYPAVLEELLPAACHDTAQYANNRIEADHGRLKARLRPMRGLKRDRSARVIIAGHAFIQNLRRGHYELGGRGAHQSADGGRVRRTRLGDLIRADEATSACPGPTQRNSAPASSLVGRIPVPAAA